MDLPPTSSGLLRHLGYVDRGRGREWHGRGAAGITALVRRAATISYSSPCISHSLSYSRSPFPAPTGSR
ncbi:MAG: hypothetical protein IPK17_30445 [Chloroflexi bacterium]|uniref:hypothetical protein n=1 Tax=Candidatus Flexifilum breve TaxID=3140694 RepID=UPI0031361D56|nr:hypothetical protein [Chloroflexota bacterium]